jgi:hypothetical protein
MSLLWYPRNGQPYLLPGNQDGFSPLVGGKGYLFAQESRRFGGTSMLSIPRTNRFQKSVDGCRRGLRPAIFSSRALGSHLSDRKVSAPRFFL